MYRIQQNSEQTYPNNNFGVDQSKQQLINFIYDKINLSNFKYDSLEVESELPQLISKTYYVSANFSGSSCLLVFAKIKDRYHQFLVDRKTLSYNVKKVDIKNVKITQTKINLDLDIYQGTIFDGIFVQNKNDKTFIITDVYLFKGQDLTKSHLDSKLFTVKTYLESNYKEDKNNDVIITVNMLFPLEKTRHLIDNVIPKIKNFSIRGICFYPEMSGTKLLFRLDNEIRTTNNNNNTNINNAFQNSQNNQNNQVNFSLFKKKSQTNFEDNVLNNTTSKSNTSNDSGSESGELNTQLNTQTNQANQIKVIQNQQFNQQPQPTQQIPKAPEIKKLVKTYYVPKEGTNELTYVFEMRKTDNTDVYTLSILKKIEKDSKKYWKIKQACLAYVPNMARSKWCKEIIEQYNGSVMVNCKFYPEKNKWEPINVSTESKPSKVNDFDTIQEN